MARWQNFTKTSLIFKKHFALICSITTDERQLISNSLDPTTNFKTINLNFHGFFDIYMLVYILYKFQSLAFCLFSSETIRLAQKLNKKISD